MKLVIYTFEILRNYSHFKFLRGIVSKRPVCLKLYEIKFELIFNYVKFNVSLSLIVCKLITQKQLFLFSCGFVSYVVTISGKVF